MVWATATAGCRLRLEQSARRISKRTVLSYRNVRSKKSIVRSHASFAAASS
jgi:hypothetical protein